MVTLDDVDALVGTVPSSALDTNGDQVVVKPVKAEQDHHLKTHAKGKASVETIAKQYEYRRDNRVVVIFPVRQRLLKQCRAIAEENDYHISRITVGDLNKFRDEIAAEVEEKNARALADVRYWFSYVGFPLESQSLLDVLDKAVEVSANNYNLSSKDWFYYQDFCFYNTKVQSRWPWMRNKLYQSFLVLILYFALTPIFFCQISYEAGVCKADPTDQNRSFYGWMNALYFASSSLSIVGYGDVSIRQGNEPYKTLFGVIYIGVAMGVALFAFSAAAGTAFSPFARQFENAVSLVIGKANEDDFLHQRMRRFRWAVYLNVFVQFTILILIGVFVSRLYANTTDVKGEEWTWLESIYWATDTVTTMGYGDLPMSTRLHWFQIFYMVLSTYFIGNALGKMANLRKDAKVLRRHYAWKRRQVTHSLIASWQCNGYDNKVDQYEFMVASLVALGKITTEDVVPIMDKFRKLSGGKGAITLKDVENHGTTDEEVDDPWSEQEVG